MLTSDPKNVNTGASAECVLKSPLKRPFCLQHFKNFLRVLEERGVDMHKVEISKAELALWG